MTSLPPEMATLQSMSTSSVSPLKGPSTKRGHVAPTGSTRAAMVKRLEKGASPFGTVGNMERFSRDAVETAFLLFILVRVSVSA